MFAYKTIVQGERAMVYGADGAVRYVDGPARVWLGSARVALLERRTAGPTQYLIVRSRDGRVEHVRGPAAMFVDPLRHEKVEVAEAVALSANEAVVVYRRLAGGAVSRRVVRGPESFVPEADEWLHTFSWHGAEAANPNRKVPHGLRFTRLRVIPDQLYFDVENVRTADDALLVVRLMIFFELLDVETLLDQTHDPIADFINGVTADVIEFMARRTFEAFKPDTAKLNQLESFPQLCARAERIGFRINKVVFRGYQGSDKLQAMHDAAIEKRTQLRLGAEVEAQAQELADLKQAREAARAAEKRAMEAAQVEHEAHLAQLGHEQKVKQAQVERDLRLRHLKAANQEKAAYLALLSNMQVDLTRYLVSQRQHPDRLIRVEGGGAARLHLHE